MSPYALVETWARLGMLLAGILFVLDTSKVHAQSETEDDTPITVDGMSIRRIYFYADQAPKLLTPGFWPVSIGELETALRQRIVNPERIDSRPYLTSAVYVARYQRGTLISDGSTFDITYQDDQPSVLDLGSMNLALETQSAATTRRLATSQSGKLRASIDPGSRLRFAWSRRGTQTPEGRLEFDLQIPPCGRTRLIIGMPKGTVLEARDGVLSALPSPPPEVQPSYGESALNWYSIEAGGLSRVRLLVQDPALSKPTDSKLVLRKLSSDCALNLRGLDWSARAVLDVPQGTELPPFLVYDGGRITDVRVNGIGVRWQETTVSASPLASRITADQSTDRQQDAASLGAVGDQPQLTEGARLESTPSDAAGTSYTSEQDTANRLVQRKSIEIVILAEPADGSSGKLPSDASVSASRVIEVFGTVPIEDLTPVDNVGDGESLSHDFRLPGLRFPLARTLLALAEQEINLTVGPGLRVSELGSSYGWQCEDTTQAAEEPSVPEEPYSNRYAMRGSPLAAGPVLRCVTSETVNQALAAFRLAVVDETLRANWEAAFELREEGPRPLQFEVQPGWQVDSVSIRSSGRVVDLRDEDPARFMLWTEPGDIADGILRVQITGSRVLSETGNGSVVPKSWFVRPSQSMLRCFAAVVPPPEYEWVPGTSLEGQLLPNQNLPPLVAEMLGPIVGDTLLFMASNGETPELQLALPPPAFNSELFLHLSMDGSQLVERLRINFRVPAGRVPSVQVQLGMGISGGSNPRPPMRWSIIDPDSNAQQTQTAPGRLTEYSKKLEARLIASNENSSLNQATGVNEIWELQPDGGIRDGLTLYGERRYPITSLTELALRDDGNGVTEERVDPVDSKQDLLPRITFPLPSLPITPSPQGSTHRATVTLGSGLDLVETFGDVLRIPRVSISSDTRPNSRGIFDNKDASERQNESWTLRYDPSEIAGITIALEPEQLNTAIIWEQHIDVLAGSTGDEICAHYRVERDAAIEILYGEDMTVSGIEGREIRGSDANGTSLKVAPPLGQNSFKVFFWRPRRDLNPLRLMMLPEITSNAVVMQKTARVWPAVDTIALVGHTVSAKQPIWMSGEAKGDFAELRQGQAIWLVPSSFGWAISSGLTLIVFSLGWLLSLRYAGLTLACLLMVVAISWGIPAWSVFILGFVAAPLAAAGLLTTAIGREQKNASVQHPKTGYASHSKRTKHVDPLAPTVTHQPNNLEFPVNVRPTEASLPAIDGIPEVSEGNSNRNGAVKALPDNLPQPPGDKYSTLHIIDASIRYKPGAWFLSTLILFVLGSLTGTPVRAISGTEDAIEGNQQPTPVMIPVRKDGSLAGDRVYIPKSLVDILFRPKGLEEQLGRIDYQSADYEVRLVSSGMRDVGDTVTIDAVWRVDIDSASKLVRLPIDPATLDRMELLVDSVPNEIRPEPDGMSVLVRLPKAGLNVIRATLSPAVESIVAGAGRIDIPIPAVANSAITIAADTVMYQVTLQQCLGRIDRSDSGTRITASLGPVDRLDIAWQRRGAMAERGTTLIKRRWWVTASDSVVCREMELELGSGLRSGVLLELTGDTGLIPQLTTRDWAFATNEGQDVSRNRIRLVSTVDSPGPIRLLWSDAVGSLADTNILLPNIRLAEYTGPVETLLAIDLPKDWRVATIGTDALNASGRMTDMSRDQDGVLPTQESSNEPRNSFKLVEPGEFIANWVGYRGTIDFARKHDDPGTINIRLQAPVVGKWTSEVTHRVVITPTHLRIDYSASLSPALNSDRPLSISLPAGLRLEYVELNGRPLPSVVKSVADGRPQALHPGDPAEEKLSPQPQESVGKPALNASVFVLPKLPSSIKSEIRVRGTVVLPNDKRFAIPRLRIRGVDVTSDQYVMSRVDGLRVRELKEPSSVTAGTLLIDYDLVAGTVPLRSWRFTDTQADLLAVNLNRGDYTELAELDESSLALPQWDGGKFRVSEVNDQFSAATLTTLNWTDGVWSMQTTVDVEDFVGLSDFVSLRIPSRWVEGLNVQPAAKWSSQPSTDGESHLVRILPVSSSLDRMVTDSQSASNSGRRLRLTITSRLENTDAGGVSVPQIAILGGGNRKNYFAVPKRLTTSPLSWQVQNARPETVDGPLADVLPTEESHTVYEAIGELFSAALQPTPVSGDSTQCPLVDFSFFPHARSDNKVLGLMRVFLLPGNRQEVLFYIPSGTTVLGAWSAGIPVGVNRLSEGQSAAAILESEQDPDTTTVLGRDGTVVRVPLALSRLADQLVLLYQFDLPAQAIDIRLPELVDIPVNVTWLQRFDATNKFSSIPESGPQTHFIARDSLGTAITMLRSALSSNEKPSDIPNNQNVDTDDSMASFFEYQEELAQSFISLLNSSIDSATERSVAEKREWLKPWFVHLRSIGWEPALGTWPDEGTTVDTLPNSESEDPYKTSELSDRARLMLDNWVPKFFQRVFGAESVALDIIDQPYLGSQMLPPVGWRASKFTRIADPQRKPVTSVPFTAVAIDPQKRSPIPQFSFDFAFPLLGIMLLLAGAKWLGGRIARSPSIWLFALGVTSLGLAPLPISISLILLSTLGPFFTRSILRGPSASRPAVTSS